MPVGIVVFEGNRASFKWANVAAGKAGTLVVLSADETCDAAAAATTKPLGVLDQDVDIGGFASMILAGCGAIVMVICGAAVALNDMLTSDASGRAIATTTVGNYVWGVCRKATANANEYALMQLSNDHIITA